MLPADVDKPVSILPRLESVDTAEGMVSKVCDVFTTLELVVFVDPDFISIGQFADTELFR